MKIKVKKFDPAVDEEPYWVEGEVAYEPYMSALQALVAFRETVEPVSYDYNCTGSVCGRCAMMVDGKPVLACVTPIEDCDHTFEPLAGFPVMRDMVIDRGRMLDKIRETQHRVRLEPFTEDDIVPPNYSAEDDAAMNKLERCLRCGMCNAACPALAKSPAEYAGPAVMVATGYRHLDAYDDADRVMEAVSNGLYRCIQCGRCSEVCPNGIDHLGLWERLRADAEAAGRRPSYADAVEASRGDIYAYAPTFD